MRIVTIAFVFLVLTLQASLACECIFPIDYTLKDAVDEHPVIFYAEVISIEDQKDPNFEGVADLYFDSLYYEKRGYEPQFRIIEILKGKIGSEQEGDRIVLQSDFSMCSSTFKIGQKYLVFAYGDENGWISVSSCSPGFLFEDQKAYRAKRREIKKALRQKMG